MNDLLFLKHYILYEAYVIVSKYLTLEIIAFISLSSAPDDGMVWESMSR